MAEGIKDKVAIIGMGCTRCGEHWDMDSDDLIVEAFQEAIEDAGIEKKDIDAAWFGSCMTGNNVGKTSMPLSMTLKLPYIPVARVENFCATGTEALRGAVYGVASGAYDICLAIGVEKLKDTGYAGLPDMPSMMGTDAKFMMSNITAPGEFAMMAVAYFEKYGLTPEEGKEILAMVSSKSHSNGAKNPKAHLRREASVEKIMNAPMVAYPLGLFDCCGVSDGAAAAIVCRADMAKSFGKPEPVKLKAMQLGLTSGAELMYSDWDGTYVKTGQECAARAYQEAGVKNPREELSLIEVHDCFSITELVTYEDLQISEKGKAGNDVRDGFFNLDGKIPCQADGGLKCFGHPIGASGLRMMYEIYLQLQGRAGDRQLKNPSLGLTHNMGGFPNQNIVSISLAGL
jgi:acetyl-CoA C-acetyltransferase